MKFKDSIAQYLNDLPNRWSANFLALLGLVNFVTIILGSAQSVYYRVINRSTQLDSNFIKDLYLNIEGTTNHIWNCITLVKEEFLVIMFLYILLYFSKTKIILKIYLCIFFIAIFIYCIKLDSIFNFMYTGEVGTLFKPTFAYPYPIIFLFTYLTAFFLEKIFKVYMPETLLKKNPLYKIFICIFSNYSCLILILLSVLALLKY